MNRFVTLFTSAGGQRQPLFEQLVVNDVAVVHLTKDNRNFHQLGGGGQTRVGDKISQCESRNRKASSITGQRLGKALTRSRGRSRGTPRCGLAVGRPDSYETGDRNDCR